MSAREDLSSIKAKSAPKSGRSGNGRPNNVDRLNLFIARDKEYDVPAVSSAVEAKDETVQPGMRCDGWYGWSCCSAAGENESSDLFCSFGLDHNPKRPTEEGSSLADEP